MRTGNQARYPDAKTVVLGQGVLGWPPIERQSGRYGTVLLINLGTLHLNPDAAVSFATAPVDTYGCLVAVVLAARPSRYRGDTARGFATATPAVGETITLGVGTLFTETMVIEAFGVVGNTVNRVGVRPDDGREIDWLNPGALHRAHDQIVRLEWRPDTDRTGGPR